MQSKYLNLDTHRLGSIAIIVLLLPREKKHKIVKSCKASLDTPTTGVAHTVLAIAAPN